MALFTLDELRALIRTSVGIDEAVDFDGDIADIPYEDLGYDSLARIEVAAQVQRRFGVEISDDTAMALETPQETLDFVNNRIGASQLPGGSQS
jgi:minimal PKS acyl carrier protein